MKLFTYGTLMRGCDNHHYLKDQTLLTKSSVGGQLWGLKAHRGFKRKYYYPVLTEGNQEVLGEIYEVDEKTFNQIKHMEESVGYITCRAFTSTGDFCYLFLGARFHPQDLEPITQWHNQERREDNL